MTFTVETEMTFTALEEAATFVEAIALASWFSGWTGIASTARGKANQKLRLRMCIVEGGDGVKKGKRSSQRRIDLCQCYLAPDSGP